MIFGSFSILSYVSVLPKSIYWSFLSIWSHLYKPFHKSTTLNSIFHSFQYKLPKIFVLDFYNVFIKQFLKSMQTDSDILNLNTIWQLQSHLIWCSYLNLKTHLMVSNLNVELYFHSFFYEFHKMLKPVV